MADDASDGPPAWWIVDRRAQREAGRQARRQERAERRDTRRHGGRGDQPREPLTPERLADVALGIVDAQGVDGLTVRALAQALGIGTMTLYWYVQNKDEVLDLVADRLLAGVTVPPPSEDWRAAVRATAVAVRRALLAHARAVPIIVSRGSFGPNGLGLLEASIGTFRAAGFGVDEAADAYFTVSNFVTGFCVAETAGPGAALDAGLDRAAFAERAGRYIRQLPPERFPNVLAAAPRMFAGRADERFLYGLEALVEGLARRLAAGRGGETAAPVAG